MFDINEFLTKIEKLNASDVHLKLGKKPVLRISGEIITVNHEELTEEDFDKIMDIILHKDYKINLKMI